METITKEYIEQAKERLAAAVDTLDDEPRRDYCRPIKTTKTITLGPDVPRERSIRIYQAGPDWWELQIRGPMTRANGSDSKHHHIAATADYLKAEDLRYLRDAIDHLLAYAEQKA